MPAWSKLPWQYHESTPTINCCEHASSASSTEWWRACRFVLQLHNIIHALTRPGAGTAKNYPVCRKVTRVAANSSVNHPYLMASVFMVGHPPVTGAVGGFVFRSKQGCSVQGLVKRSGFSNFNAF